MNTQAPSETELEKIEATYSRLKPLRDLEAAALGLQRFDWRSALTPAYITLSCALVVGTYGAGYLVSFLCGVGAVLSWQLFHVTEEGKRFNLIVASLRAMSDELRELRKKPN